MRRWPLLLLASAACRWASSPLDADCRSDGVVHRFTAYHFIPWAKYPVDLGHNFVLAHGRCNAAKTDYLAAEKHLERWGRRNEDHGGWLETEFSGGGIQHDLKASESIARWAYDQTKLADGLVWDHGKTLVPLGDDWFGVFRYVRP